MMNDIDFQTAGNMPKLSMLKFEVYELDGEIIGTLYVEILEK